MNGSRIAGGLLVTAVLATVAGCANHKEDFAGLCKLATEVDGKADKSPEEKFAELQLRAKTEVKGHAQTAVLAVGGESLKDDRRYPIVVETAADFDVQYSCPQLERVLSKAK